MWEIYDRLIEGIPDNVFVEEMVCGMTWTAVRSSRGTVGLAMTTPVQTRPNADRNVVGKNLKDTAQLIKSWNFIDAGIGMAAINAWYNSAERMNELDSKQADSRFCSYDIPFDGKNVCMVGALRYPQGMFDSAKSLIVMERNLVDGTYPDSACEYYLPESDLVIITGSAFINKTMPRLLQLAKNAQVVITGPSTPMAPQLMDYGVRRLTGLVITQERECMNFAESGVHATPYRFGEMYAVDKYE
ncbi:MAG: hypothetical protein IKV47_04910 [Oscillospiraceae bacterium]|nr:hypothetical protein [Oscillospiraceae bacterium]